MIALDPFDGVTDADEVCKTIEDTSLSIVRAHGNFNLRETTQLKKWLVNVLHVCRFCGMDKMLRVLNVRSPKWDDAFGKYADRIPEEVAMDFMDLREMSMKARRDEIQSTVNRLRTFLSPMVKQMFSRKCPAFSFQRMIARGESMIVNLGTSERFSREQGVVVAGLVMNEVFKACQTVSHPQHTLAIDEAGMFVGDDLSDALTRARHWGLSIWLGFQNTACLQDGISDAAKQAMSQGQMHFTFRHNEPDEIDYLARMFAYHELDFTEHVTPMQFCNGYKWHKVDEYSESISFGRTRTVSSGRTWSDDEGQTITLTNGDGHSLEIGEGASRTVGESSERGVSVDKGTGGSRSRNRSKSQTQSSGDSFSDGWGSGSSTQDDETGRHKGSSDSLGRSGGRSVSHGDSQGTTEGEQEGESWKASQSEKQSEGSNRSLSLSTNRSRGRNQSRSLSVGASRSRSRGGSESESYGDTVTRGASVSHRVIPLAQHELILWKTGKLAVSTEDQIAKMKKVIATLKVGECVMMLPEGRVQTFQFPKIEEKHSEEWMEWIEQDIKVRIAKRLGYFSPVQEEWTGVSATTKSGRSRPSIPAPRSNGSPQESSAITRLQQDVQRISENVSEELSRIADRYSSETPEGSPTCTADGNHKASSTR
jgi:hypothetical protein